MTFNVKMAVAALQKFNAVIEEKKDFLTDLDAATGDSDHGINMNRGTKRVAEKIQSKEYVDFGELFRDVAMTIMSVVGGAAGPLYGTFFMKASQKLGASAEVSTREIASAMQEGLAGVMSLGKSSAGDKTMVDTLEMAIKALVENAGDGGELAWSLCVTAAKKGMESTKGLLSRRGRSSFLGERSIGHQDPGATSAYYLMSCFRDAFLEGRGTG
jgi:dihydroxyacetone kinase-like protein